MRSSWLPWLAACIFAVNVCQAQVPTVPVNHYGPPLDCPGDVKINKNHASQAEAEIHEGELQSWMGTTRTLTSNEPVENFGIARLRLADYADCVGDSGCYWSDLDAQYRRAEEALAAELNAAKKGEKLAVVMDIDETTLSSYCEMKREAFGYIAPMFEPWIVSEEAAVAIPGAKRFFDEARTHGVAVFFITGRGEAQRTATARNLKIAGFDGYAALALRSKANAGQTALAYKSSERQRLVSQGYRLLISVGDQWSDLEGPPLADVSVKLPNPFYFLP